MTYVNVAPLVPLTPLTDELTYAATPQLLATLTVGRLVRVRVRNRRALGVVTRLVRHRPPGVSRLAVIEEATSVILPAATLALAEAMRRWSWHSLGSCLATVLPTPLARLPIVEPLPASPSKLITPRSIALIGSPIERWRRYATLVAKAQRAGRSTLMLFSSQATLTAYQQASTHQAVSWLSEGSVGARWRQWAALATSQEPVIVIGLRGAASAPVPRLGLIIIDDPQGRGHKSDQAPYLTSRSLAALRQPIERCHVVYGDVLPPLELSRTPHRYPRVMLLPADPSNPTTLQAASERWLQERVDRGPMFILLNRVGSGSRRCASCRTAVRCPRCTSVVTEERPGQLRCSRCRWQGAVPTSCAVCGSHVLVSRGTGTEAIARRLEQLLGQPTLVLDRNSPSLEEPHSPVVVGSSFALPYLSRHPPTASLILGTDEARERASYDAREHTLQTIQAVAAATRGPTALETYFSDDPWYQALAVGAIDHLLTAELSDRRRHGYPPDTRLVTVRGSDRDALVALATAIGTVSGVVGVIGPYQRAGTARVQLMIKLQVRADREALFGTLARRGLLDRLTVEPDPIAETLD